MTKQTKSNMNRKRTKRGRLSDNEKAIIINGYQSKSVKDLASELNRSDDQISKFIENDIKANSTINKPAFETRHKMSQQGAAVVMTERASEDPLTVTKEDKPWVFRQPGT
jgi:translation initiation factor 2 beta subunit (eIF-2beta)/eIF-5